MSYNKLDDWDGCQVTIISDKIQIQRIIWKMMKFWKV